MSTPIDLVVGLGNPGPQYEHTRHNAGFRFVDALAARHGASFRTHARFFGELTEISVAGRRVRLLKPMTYMNESGRSVGAVARFYRYAPDAVLVVHDEIDLPAGTVRLKRGGGEGGNRGLRSVTSGLGGNAYVRLRIGVGHPGSAPQVVDFVLKRASADDQRATEEAAERAYAVMGDIIGGDLGQAMNTLNRREADAKAPAPDSAEPGFEPPKPKTVNADSREAKSGAVKSTAKPGERRGL
ncbi:MAG: aminoacyl-tRNA hydrolase [Gammaproteobacteria bacterium]